MCSKGLCKIGRVQKADEKEVGSGGHIARILRPETEGPSQSPKKKEVLRDQRSKLATKAIESGGNTKKNEFVTQECVGGKDRLGMD